MTARCEHVTTRSERCSICPIMNAHQAPIVSSALRASAAPSKSANSTIAFR
jgi:hypothetical protein